MASSIIDLIGVLDKNRSKTPAFKQGAPGPLRPIYSVEFKFLAGDSANVPRSLVRLISTIDKSGGPYDMSADRTNRSDETIGAMRQIHSNQDPTWLPIQTRNPLDHLDDSDKTGRMRAYDSYVTKFKQQTNGNGGSNVTTGYIEYTASDETTFTPDPPRRARIVFDYVNARVFLSPQHYHSWEIAGNKIDLISGNDAKLNSNHPSAFYWITEITTVY